MPTSENLIFALVGFVVGGGLALWAGTYLGRLWAKLEAYVAKEKNAMEADAAHVAALFREVKTLYQEFDAKAKADAATVKADVTKVVETVEKL
jgi:hypothetical protein